MKRLVLAGMILMGVMLLAAPMVQADITEGFEGAFPPAGWTSIDASGNAHNDVKANTGMYCVQFNANGDELITPLLDTPDTLTYYMQASADDSSFIVEQADNVAGPWTIIALTTTDYLGAYVQETVDLSSYTDIYVRFRRNSTKYYYLDDIVITGVGAGPGPGPGPGPDVDVTGSISISAVIAGLTSMTVTDESSDGSVGFGSITSEFQTATEYILVEASSNYGGWGIELYTDNFPLSTPDPADWGYAYGGLVDVANMRKIPLGWCAFDAEDLAGETPANPGDANRWTYVKDKSDVDDPSTAANDESWNARGGYCNVAWGVAATGYVVNPNNLASDPIYTDPMNDGNLYVYLETAGTAAPGNYTGSVYFDLYHE